MRPVVTSFLDGKRINDIPINKGCLHRFSILRPLPHMNVFDNVAFALK